MIRNDSVPAFDSQDEIQHWVLRTLLEHGQSVSPRGMETLELFPVAITLKNPRCRRLLNPIRKWSLPLAIGEFCWHVSGSNELGFIEYYAPQWRNFTDDGETIRGSCYGHRIFNSIAGLPTQWERVVRIIKSDQHSRRAILHFSDSSEFFTDDSKDVPCATTLQFFVRSGVLHAVCQMRSNDAIWGLPYDIFLFTMLQELMACELKIELGSYSHFVGSLHLYERHFDLARRIIQAPLFSSMEMPKMVNSSEVARFLNLEEKLRRGEDDSSRDFQLISDYWRVLFAVLKDYRSQKDEKERRPNLPVQSKEKDAALMHAVSS